MKVLITGASGLVGRSLSCFFESKGWKVGRVVREEKGGKGEVYWDPNTGSAKIDAFEGWDAVVHLAGESLSKGIWTKRKREKIRESRIVGTQNLVKVLDSCKSPPNVFIVASAVGFYGNREGELTEESSAGEGFLAEVCQDLEKAAVDWKINKPRIVRARFGYILSPEGGFLKALKPLFLWGLGGKIAGGKQYLPWIALEDVIKGLHFIIQTEDLQGPVNLVAPKPVRQEVFAKIFAKVLHRPCFFSIPKSFLFGKKAKALILPSLEVYPSKLIKAGFIFSYSRLLKALKSFQ